MFMKDAAFLEQLQQELPRRSLSPKATQRFEDTYKMLGVQQEAPVKKRRHKALWVTATAACLCCGMLFGVNAAFPAFAEGLPGVGRFFEAVNSSFQTIGNSKAAHGANVGTYDTQDVNVAASSGDYSMEVLEAFSDGKNLTFSMDVATTSELWNRYDWVGVGSNLNGETTTLTVNGTPVETSFSDTLERGEDNHYTGAVSFALPEAVEDGTELNVEFSVTQLTFPDKFTYEGYVYVDVDWNSAFTVTADASGNKAFAADASDAGVEILNVDASATETLITTNIPDWYATNFQAILYTMDGTELRYSTPTTPRPADATTTVLTFDGAPAGTEQLVLRYYDDEKGEDTRDKVKAEFLIDLTSGMVAPSSTYDDGGALDLESPFHYKYLEAVGTSVKNDADFTNGFAIERISYAKEGSWEVSLLTNEAYREVMVEVYTAGGELIGSTVSEYGTNEGQTNWFWDENSPWWGGNWQPAPVEGQGGYPYYAYRLYLDGENTYLPAINETVTVVVKDNATGEELVRQDLLMDSHSFGGTPIVG